MHDVDRHDAELAAVDRARSDSGGTDACSRASPPCSRRPARVRRQGAAGVASQRRQALTVGHAKRQPRRRTRPGPARGRHGVRVGQFRGSPESAPAVPAAPGTAFARVSGEIEQVGLELAAEHFANAETAPSARHSAARTGRRRTRQQKDWAHERGESSAPRGVWPCASGDGSRRRSLAGRDPHRAARAVRSSMRTSNPSSRSHAAGDARPNGWRPSS